MVRVCGACTALLAFAVSILRGLAVDNPTDTILIRALWSLVTFFIIGLGLGWVSQTVIGEYNQHMREQEARERAKTEDKAAAKASARATNVVSTADAANAAADEATGGQREAERTPEGAGARTG